MWSDELDNKMKEATEGYHPAYDEKAWDKMELLLDKHLPQEKKRRRFILLLLPLLLVGTGILLITQKRGKDGITEEKNTIVKPVSVKKQVEPEKSVTVTAGATGTKAAVLPGSAGTIAPVSEPARVKKSIAETTPKKEIFNRIGSFPRIKKARQVVPLGQQRKPKTSSVLVEDNSDPKGQGNRIIAIQPSEQNTNITATDKANVNNSITPVPIDSAASLPQIAQSAYEKKQPDSSENKNEITDAKPQKQKNSPGSKLSINFSAGPDISSVGIDNPGKWNLQYGVGLSYVVLKRLSIRTGFFAGRKKYSADSTEYYSSYYPPKLERIDANCLVYEIPVNLVYSFPAVKKHNWFIAGGLSSYLMKKETYEYYYKNAWGQPQYYSRTYKNKNSHLFSVINISGGYQYHFTDRLSVLAEPYVRIPVSGIGSGKVKLNSGGVLFTLGFKPFLKRN